MEFEEKITTMPDTVTVEQRVKFIAGISREVMIDQGHHLATVVAETEEDRLAVVQIPLMPDTPDGRVMAMGGLGKMLAGKLKCMPPRLYFISEGWAWRGTELPTDDLLPPQRADKLEVLMVEGASIDGADRGECAIVVGEIRRAMAGGEVDKVIEVKLGEVERPEAPSRMLLAVWAGVAHGLLFGGGGK